MLAFLANIIAAVYDAVLSYTHWWAKVDHPLLHNPVFLAVYYALWLTVVLIVDRKVSLHPIIRKRK